MKVRQIQNKSSNYKKYLIAFGVFVFIVTLGGTGYFFYYIKGDISKIFEKQSMQESKPKDKPDFDFSLNGFTPVSLLIPSGAELVRKDIRVLSNPVIPQMIESIVAELIKSMPEDMRDIQLNTAYKDRDGIVYLDFNAVLFNKTVFDVTREGVFLKSLYQTLMTNIQGLSDVRILVEGREVETIGGHFNIANGMRFIFNETQK